MNSEWHASKRNPIKFLPENPINRFFFLNCRNRRQPSQESEKGNEGGREGGKEGIKEGKEAGRKEGRKQGRKA